MTLHKPRPRYGWHGSLPFVEGATVRYIGTRGTMHNTGILMSQGPRSPRNPSDPTWVVNWKHPMQPEATYYGESVLEVVA